MAAAATVDSHFYPMWPYGQRKATFGSDIMRKRFATRVEVKTGFVWD